MHMPNLVHNEHKVKPVRGTPSNTTLIYLYGYTFCHMLNMIWYINIVQYYTQYDKYSSKGAFPYKS